MERYLMEEEISDEEINQVFGKALLAGSVVPILCLSTEKDVGVEKTLDVLINLAPTHDAPIPRPLVDRQSEAAEGAAVGSADDPLLARVFKVVGDPFVGKLSYLRIFAGTVTPNMPIVNIMPDVKERTATVLRVQGKDQITIERTASQEVVSVLHGGCTSSEVLGPFGRIPWRGFSLPFAARPRCVDSLSSCVPASSA